MARCLGDCLSKTTTLVFEDVVTRERYGVDPLAHLDLVNDEAGVAEASLAGREIEFPQTAEPFIINGGYPIPVCHEPLPPRLQRFGVMQAQDLYVGDVKAGDLDDRHHFGERGRVYAREDVFSDPSVGATRAVSVADRMDQCHAVIGEQLSDLSEILAVVSDTDMLEHADRDDAIVPPSLMPIVFEQEPHA